MTTAGQREEKERELLATLFLEGKAYEQLPEDFTEGAFEVREYRDVYRQLRPIIEAKGDISEQALLRRDPGLRTLVDQILWAASPLNGRLRAGATALMRHRPEPAVEMGAAVDPATQRSSGEDHGSRFHILNGLEIVKMEIPAQSFLIKDLLSEQSVNFLSGEEGCGKSLLAMNLAISVAVGGKKWLAYEIAKQGSVIYLNNEMAFPAFARRLKAMAEKLPACGSLENLIVPNEVPAITECWDALTNLCEHVKPCLIILDCLYFAHDKDENDSSAMKALMRQFLALRDRYNTAVLLVHHTKKGSQYSKMHNDQMRGSNVFGGITDTVLQMRRSATDESRRIIKPTKFRHVSDENRKCRLLSLDPVNLWFKDEGETTEGDHIAVAGQTAEEQIDFKEVFGGRKELSRKDIVEACRPSGYEDRTIDRLLNKAKSTGALKTPRFGVYSL